MIVFKTIRYKNFLSSGNHFIEIELNSQKTVLIMGHNGSGKSTLLDALTFSLFGKPFRNVNKGDVMNSTNNKNCLVEIEFSIGKNEYKIVRGIKPNKFEIWRNDSLLNQDSTTRDYQEYLEKNILKLNYKTFCQVVILGSASYKPFMSLEAGDRRKVIETLLDIQIFSAMTAIVKGRLETNRDELEKNRISLTSKQENKAYITKTLETLKSNNAEKIEKLKTEKSNNEKSLKVWQTGLIEQQKELNELLDQIIGQSLLKSRHTKLVEYKSKIESNRDKLYTESRFLQDHDTCPTCKQEIQEDFRNSRINTNNIKTREFDEGLLQISDEINGVLEDLEKMEDSIEEVQKCKQTITMIESSIDVHKRKINELTSQIDKLTKSDTLTTESEEELRIVTSDISKLEKEKASLLEERQYIDTASILLKDGGIKTKIVRQYLPIMNKSINRYLSKMNFLVDFYLDENFKETLKSRYRDKFSYQSFSEGEKLRIDLALLLTWRHIAKKKNSVSVNILVFDEILDRSMDDFGVDDFMKLMYDLSKETNVFVISHKSEMMEKFQKVIQFEKVKGFSVMKREA